MPLVNNLIEKRVIPSIIWKLERAAACQACGLHGAEPSVIAKPCA